MLMSAVTDTIQRSVPSFKCFSGKNLDANLLLIPLDGFLPASDPRVLGTIEAIERRLTVDGFVLRYDSAALDDGLPPGEGAFLACSFWLADNLVFWGNGMKRVGFLSDCSISGMMSVFWPSNTMCREVGNWVASRMSSAMLAWPKLLEISQR